MVELPEQIVVVPVMLVGAVGGVLMVTFNVRSVLLPLLLFALTLMFPLLVPGVIVMLVPVELPDHPLGKAHV